MTELAAERDKPHGNEKYSTVQIIEALKAVNGMVYLAARKLGCEAKTIYRRAKKAQVIQRAIDDSRGETVDLAEQKLRAAVWRGDSWAVAFTLRTLGKARGYTERHEIGGPEGGAIPIRMITMEIPKEKDADESG